MENNHGNSSLPEHIASGSGTSNRPASSGFCSRYVHYTRDFPPGCGSNVSGAAATQPKGVVGKSNASAAGWWRKVGAAKGKLGSGGECDRIIVKRNKGSTNNSEGERAKIQEMLKLFRERFDKITETRDENEKGRVDIKVMNELTKEGKIIKRCSSIIGPVPGIEVGDRFRYRVELVIVGLHKHNERGIDTTTDSSGLKKVATCVVANADHFDKINDPNMLTYIGEGGKPRGKTVENPNPNLNSKSNSKPSDQELKGGNLALLESKMSNSPVRVVKGFKVNWICPRRGRTVERTEYIYDGLYEVKSCKRKQGLMKNWIFEFELFRCPGQPVVCLKGCKR